MGRTAGRKWILIVLGYKNRNRTETVRSRSVRNNKIEPGGPTTVSRPSSCRGRQTTIFAIKVPKNFGKQEADVDVGRQRQPAVVSFYLNPEYNLNFYKEVAKR
jgi:hypothetical protein